MEIEIERCVVKILSERGSRNTREKKFVQEVEIRCVKYNISRSNSM